MVHFQKNGQTGILLRALPNGGMTSSMISAEAITNQILNRPNEMMEIFSPGREVSTSAILSMMKDGAHTVMDFSQYIIPDTGKRPVHTWDVLCRGIRKRRLMNVRAMVPGLIKTENS